MLMHSQGNITHSACVCVCGPCFLRPTLKVLPLPLGLNKPDCVENPEQNKVKSLLDWSQKKKSVTHRREGEQQEGERRRRREEESADCLPN